MRDKYKVFIALFLLISIISSSAYLFLPTHFQSLDARIRDFYFKFRGPEPVNDTIIIIDIDEKSIKELGQWPWERNKFAKILTNLSQAGAGMIGLDIIFSEKDKTSPSYIAQKFHLEKNELPDYDVSLAKTIAQTPTILGYVFDFDNVNEKEAPRIPVIFVQKYKKEEFLPLAKGVLPNLEIIQEAGYSSGYINNIPDDNGMIRSIPMFIVYDMELFPSLAMEMYRLSLGASKVEIDYSEAGIYDIKLKNKHILSDRFGKLHLNFRGAAKSYKYISAIDIYNGNFLTSDIKNKFILIGTSAYGLMDLRSTPMDSVIPGVELHANALDNLLSEDMLYKPNWIEAVDLLTIIFITFFVLFILSRLKLWFLLSSYFIMLIALLSINYYFLFQEHIILSSVFQILTMIISIVATLAINYMFESKNKELIKNSSAKKVSKQVMDDLLTHPTVTDLSAREENVTVYFSDIRSFTTISEDLHSPQRVTDFLNYYMNIMVEPIEKSSGTIDKFIGDAIMAYWNAPLKVNQHADKAVQSALQQIKIRDEINITIHKEFGFNVDYGIGINTADVIVGEIGSKGRSDYTIIGDGVNLASRLEGLCKVYKVRLIISEFTKEKLTEDYVVQLLDIVKVKGKKEPVKIYEVLDLGEADSQKKVELALYEKAHRLYLESKFTQAKAIFDALENSYEKNLYTFYAKRCEKLEKENIKEFDGVFEFTQK